MRRGPIGSGNSLNEGQEVEVEVKASKMIGYYVQSEGGALEGWAMQNSVIHTLASEQQGTTGSFKHKRDRVKYVFTKALSRDHVKPEWKGREWSEEADKRRNEDLMHEGN